MLTGFSLSRPGVGPESRYRLPGAGMRLVRVPQEQANAYGLKSVLNSKTAQTNAEHISLSNETRTLIQCRARLSDVYSEVLNVMESYWGSEQVDRITEQFCNLYSELDTALWSLISDIMADTMLSENFKKM